MAYYFKETSRTFHEYILVPNLTAKDNTLERVSLKTPLVKFSEKETPQFYLNIPLVSAIMQSVSNHTLAIALARCGGLAFIYGSQSIQSQAEMVKRVKFFKAGFVVSDSNVRPEDNLRDVLEVIEKTDHTTMAVTHDGTPHGRLEGILTSRDYRIDKHHLTTKVRDLMTPFNALIYAKDSITLMEANDLVWDKKLNTLPIIDKERCLRYLVFRKDYDEHMANPEELVDREKRLLVGAGINTRDYQERVPELVQAGADVLCIDSSDGYTEWQSDTIKWIKKQYGNSVKLGAGNIVDREGFRYLVEAGADFIKVGIGGGAICITREQKGIGLGQATAVMQVARARDEYFQETGIYIPICSDGGIVLDYHISLALAMGADFIMMGRYFARFDESPGRRFRIQGNFVKEYWGEGSDRARNWQRYDLGKIEARMAFEEGVDAYVPYAGKLKDNLNLTITKIKSTMCNCGALSLQEFRDKARISLVSTTSIREGGAHDVILKETEVPSGPS